MLEENYSSKNFFVLNASYLEELVTSTTFDGYKGIQNTNLMVVVGEPVGKRVGYASTTTAYTQDVSE